MKYIFNYNRYAVLYVIFINVEYIESSCLISFFNDLFHNKYSLICWITRFQNINILYTFYGEIKHKKSLNHTIAIITTIIIVIAKVDL